MNIKEKNIRFSQTYRKRQKILHRNSEAITVGLFTERR